MVIDLNIMKRMVWYRAYQRLTEGEIDDFSKDEFILQSCKERIENNEGTGNWSAQYRLQMRHEICFGLKNSTIKTDKNTPKVKCVSTVE